MMDFIYMKIPIDSIDPPPVYMRNVDENSAEFLELVESIRPPGGLHNSILVRPLSTGRYQLIDGAYRFAAHRKLELPSIDCIVRVIPDAEVLIAQIQANAIRRETSRVEYAKQLRRIQAENPQMTLAGLARLCGKSSYWVRQQLDLLSLKLDYQVMVERGQIAVDNAYSLSKLPPHLQDQYIKLAMDLPAAEFKPIVAAEVQRMQLAAKDRSEADRIERVSNSHPYLRSFKELTKELNSRSAANALIAHARPANVVDAFTLGVQWALNVDPLSLESRKA